MNLFSQKEATAFVKTGAKEFRFSRDTTRLTPGAKDILIAAGVKVVYDANAGGHSAAPASPPAKTEPWPRARAIRAGA